MKTFHKFIVLGVGIAACCAFLIGAEQEDAPIGSPVNTEERLLVGYKTEPEAKSSRRFNDFVALANAAAIAMKSQVEQGDGEVEVMEQDETGASDVVDITSRQMVTALEDALENEPVNYVWTDRVEAEVETLLSRMEFEGGTVHDVDCHSSVCKVVIGLNSTDKLDDFFAMNIVERGPWNGGNQHHDVQSRAGGEHDLVIYFSNRDDEHSFNRIIERALL